MVRRRVTTGRLLAIGTAAASAMLMMPQGAEAAQVASGPVWTLQTPAQPAGATSSSLTGVSCPAVGACMAVGEFEGNGNPFAAFADQWNGSTWTIETLPNALSSDINSVSCVSMTDCVAVGEIAVGLHGDLAALALQWNGTTWTAMTIPSLKVAVHTFLNAVSCPSATSCTAVGYYQRQGRGYSLKQPRLLVERWNGSTWTIRKAPEPSGTTTAQLNAVSCKSPRSCVAVGNTGPIGGTAPDPQMYAETWNGSGWASQAPSSPSGSASSDLYGVSCPAATACTAVGYYMVGTTQYSAAESWNGTAWTAQTTPNPNPDPQTDYPLGGVSCHKTTSCLAVGTYFTIPAEVAQSASWNGRTWAGQDPGVPPGATQDNLATVSCPAVNNCVTVGDYINPSNGDSIMMAGLYAKS
ncbi:MAG: hypothetical protein ACRDNF_18620 [Streptosporangiaceae bacterium]